MTTKAQSARVPGRGEITRLLEKMREGDPKAEEELLSRVYHELRALAVRKMANEAPSQTRQPTALVDEAWLRLTRGTRPNWPDRAYFFAAAGEAMRRILVEKARRRKRLKRGGHLQRLDIDTLDLPAPLPDDKLLALDEALERLDQFEPRPAELVKLRFFVGLTQARAAKELGVSASTAERDWAFARAWLFREVEKSLNPSPQTRTPSPKAREQGIRLR